MVLSLVTMVVYSLRHVDEVARMQSIVRDLDQLNAAVSLFELQYDALPGDFNRDEPRLLRDRGAGDGDGRIASEIESLVVWEHLDQAEILEVENKEPIVKHQRPMLIPILNSSVEQLGFRIYAPESPIHGQTGNMVHAGRESGVTLLNDGILTPNEAAFVDSKMDDGEPMTGRLLIDGPAGSGCLKESVDTIELFLPAQPDCSLHWLLLPR